MQFRRRLVHVAVVAVLLSSSAFVFPHAAYAAECRQNAKVWVGGRNNNGVLSSESPGGLIVASVNGSGVYLTGVVRPNTIIRFFFTHTNGVPAQEFDTVPAGGNCVVPHDVRQDIVFLDADPNTFQQNAPVPDTQQVFASYVLPDNGPSAFVNLGTIQVNP